MENQLILNWNIIKDQMNLKDTYGSFPQQQDNTFSLVQCVPSPGWVTKNLNKIL
jgi:hypothetical protein